MLSPTQGKIHEVAIEHFLKDGFQKASLRKIVSDAGFTLGAFYGYYDSKEALFNALVEETAQGIVSIISRMGDRADGLLLPEKQWSGMSEVFAEGLPVLVDYLLEHKQETKLLLKCSEGTHYENFLLDLMERDLDFIDAMAGGSFPLHPLAAKLLVNSYFSLFGEAVLQGESREDVMQAMQDIQDVFAGGIVSYMQGSNKE